MACTGPWLMAVMPGQTCLVLDDSRNPLNASGSGALPLIHALLGRCLASCSDLGFYRPGTLQSIALSLEHVSRSNLSQQAESCEIVLAAQAGCPVQNLEPVLRACPELQKLNLASCALLGQSALDALLPGGAGSSQYPSRQQVRR